eukprot:EG_transcript_24805
MRQSWMRRRRSPACLQPTQGPPRNASAGCLSFAEADLDPDFFPNSGHGPPTQGSPASPLSGVRPSLGCIPLHAMACLLVYRRDYCQFEEQSEEAQFALAFPR